MLKHLQKRKSDSGFTIIEVLIVLAIAGLIMVVVFLAVPALQRSGRNNGLNTSANNVLSAVGNYASNNGGTLPATAAIAAVSGGSLTVGSSGNTETVKVDAGVSNYGVNGTPITSSAAIGTIQVITGTTAVCNASNTGLSGTGSARSYVVLYTLEGGGGTNLVKCVGT
jgi:prepilin-type N-terminal cleavage/methylation domain-containing protein